MSLNPPLRSSSYDMFSFKIPLEDWTILSEGEYLVLDVFETLVPPEGRRVKWGLSVYPKGEQNEENAEEMRYVEINLFTCEDDGIKVDLGQFHMETAYRIRKPHAVGPLDMSNSNSFTSFHSKIFEFKKYVLLSSSYEAGSVEDRAENGFLTLEFEMRTFWNPHNRIKFQFSGIREEFLNNFEAVDSRLGDVKLISGGEEIACHKFLLVAQSPVFKAMFEMDSKEKEENVVNILDSTPDAVRSFVRFLYDGILRLATIYYKDHEHIFGLLNLANKYQVGLLVTCCMDTLINIMDVDNVLKIFAVVDKFELGYQITSMVIDFMKENIGVIIDKEDWPAFAIEYPSLLKNFVLNINEERLSFSVLASKAVKLCEQSLSSR